MSLLSWLGKANSRLISCSPEPQTPGLPDPNKEQTDAKAQLLTSANAAIDKASVVVNRKRKRGTYHSYDRNLHLKIYEHTEINSMEIPWRGEKVWQSNLYQVSSERSTRPSNDASHAD